MQWEYRDVALNSSIWVKRKSYRYDISSMCSFLILIRCLSLGGRLGPISKQTWNIKLIARPLVKATYISVFE
jgi:hypothetical protein